MTTTTTDMDRVDRGRWRWWWVTVAAVLATAVAEASLRDEVSRHLELGGEMLAGGQLQDALSHYHAAVDGDPSNYLTYFKRGTVYLAMAKASLALADFDKALGIKPDFVGAKYQRAQILLKRGELEAARREYAALYEVDGNYEAYDSLVRMDRVAEEVREAEAYVKQGAHSYALSLLTSAVEACPWWSRLRELRARCYEAVGEPMHAVSDLRSATKLSADNTAGYYRLSLLLYRLGYPEDSLREIRQCLKLDPDHKDCFPHYKKVKKVARHASAAQEALDAADYETCVSSAEKLLAAEKEMPAIAVLGQEKLCRCLVHVDQVTRAVAACSEAVRLSETPASLCDRADAYLAGEMYDEALRDFQRAQELDPGLQRAAEGVQQAQRLLKQSEKRNYYKILGVKRTANKQEVTKAYRKLAQKWHPDNFPDDREKKLAQKKFIDIAAAKEVLTDPDKRRKFDQGEDPLDPESGHHQDGFNPFQHFNQFHSGGPFTFKFHFN